jgi:hypothetical protein
MKIKCPRCRAENLPVARFCAQCGLSLQPGSGGKLEPGRIHRPDAVAVPEGFQPCEGAEHLSFRWGSAWGNSFLSGTEGIAVGLFNGAYPLRNVVLEIRGADESSRQQFAVKHTLESLPRGQETIIEVPSYEVPAPVSEVAVSLVSAELGPEP